LLSLFCLLLLVILQSFDEHLRLDKLPIFVLFRWFLRWLFFRLGENVCFEVLVREMARFEILVIHRRLQVELKLVLLASGCTDLYRRDARDV
jgi:hypothetical protein